MMGPGYRYSRIKLVWGPAMSGMAEWGAPPDPMGPGRTAIVTGFCQRLYVTIVTNVTF